MKLNILGRVVLYLSVATIFFLSFVNLVQFPSHKKDEVSTTNITISTVQKIEKNRKENVRNSMQNKKKEIKEINFLEKLPKIVFFDYISSKNSRIIVLIYLSITFTFLLQTTLLALSNYYDDLLIFGEKRVDNMFIYISEWTVNVPPVLGVVGTIFSFGIVVSHSDIGNLSIVFKENFANAALTTILGGVVYVLNLLLNIFIVKNLSTSRVIKGE